MLTVNVDLVKYQSFVTLGCKKIFSPYNDRGMTVG